MVVGTLFREVNWVDYWARWQSLPPTEIITGVGKKEGEMKKKGIREKKKRNHRPNGR